MQLYLYLYGTKIKNTSPNLASTQPLSFGNGEHLVLSFLELAIHIKVMDKTEIKRNAIYKYKEVRKLLGIGRVRAERFVREGKLKPSRIGKGGFDGQGSYSFLGSEIISFIKNLK